MKPQKMALFMPDAAPAAPAAAGAVMAASGAHRRMRPGRRVADKLLRIACFGCTAFGIFVLGSILAMLLVKGFSALSVEVFTKVTPGPNSPGGGIANAILGSLVLTVIGIGIATPVGVLAGTWLAEYGRGSALATLIRFINDVLLSAPSILIGLFVYTFMVRPFGYNGWAGGVALAIIATPVIVRTTEDMLRIVPGSLREAGVALGAPMAKVVTGITWRAARSGMVTGILLATARITGETAPLLFTAFNNNYWFRADLMGGIPNLPVMIYKYALSPYENWQNLAWAGALLITLAILALSIGARLMIRKEKAL